MRELSVGIVMIIMEVMGVGSNTLSKAAMAKGMSNYIFITYTHAIGCVLLIPVALLVHRKSPVPSIGYSILVRIFLLALFCYCYSIFTLVGIRYSSPTLASAMSNLSPGVTFIIAIIFRMEILDPGSQSSVLKLTGTLVSIVGAFIVTFYQGPSIIISPSSSNDVSLHSLLGTQHNWVVGACLLATSSIFLSLLFIVKTWIARDFNSEVVITLISSFFETIIAASVALFTEKDKQAWEPIIDIELIAIIVGAVIIAMLNVGSTWACKEKGPVFVAMFTPLDMIIAIIMGVSFLKDVLHFGSVIGGITIALGFYTVMKGKTMEEKLENVDQNISTNSTENSHEHEVPLLHDKNNNV